VGITIYPNDATDIDALLKNADQAMYQAKNLGRNRFSFFTAALQEAAQKRMRLSNDLRRAIKEHQFLVHYQPIIELASGRIYKAEALVRWNHPVRGLVSPAEFIPLAEETGMIVEIGDWVFKEAAQQCKLWRNNYDREFQISVNKSPVQFHHYLNRPREWINYMRKLDLPGTGIVIEITEGLLLNVQDTVKDKLLAFRDAGVQVSIDDFGTGYSSLSYLKQLDIDYLKIDQSFVRNLESDPNNMALCEAIIMMAHKLGLKAIAEGVSSEAQRELLARAGCDYAQGFLFSKPVPAHEFEKLLR
jgi:EAL domain-containing protein (putative c-di-GMP-specific phosphodiesterase class I)